jgi:UDPglucose 6-dehydrogenase
VTALAAPTAFLGLSHLGIVSSVGWASFGRPVLAVDPEVETVAQLARGDLPIHEPGLADLLERSAAHIMFSNNLALLADCSLVIVSRDVPTDATNHSDLKPIEALIDQAVPYLKPGVVLVVMSQVPPGFTHALGKRVRAVRPELPFQLFYWVETLIFGEAVNRTLHPERFIVGCADPVAPLPGIFEAGLEAYSCPILKMAYASAELTKTAINFYLAGSVTYANTLSDLCEAIGADWSEIVPALQLDKRIGPAAYLHPSLGVAGGNLERDLITLQNLCHTHDVDATYLDSLVDYNNRRFEWVTRHLRDRVFSRVARPNIGIWGLTYKRNTRSTKNSPGLRLIGELSGRARMRAWDPAVAAGDVATDAEVVGAAEDVLAEADCLVIMADWDDFARAELHTVRDVMRRPLVIDCPGVLQQRRAELRSMRIEYVGMGQQACAEQHS